MAVVTPDACNEIVREFGVKARLESLEICIQDQGYTPSKTYSMLKILSAVHSWTSTCITNFWRVVPRFRLPYTGYHSHELIYLIRLLTHLTSQCTPPSPGTTPGKMPPSLIERKSCLDYGELTHSFPIRTNPTSWQSKQCNKRAIPPRPAEVDAPLPLPSLRSVWLFAVSLSPK